VGRGAGSGVEWGGVGGVMRPPLAAKSKDGQSARQNG